MQRLVPSAARTIVLLQYVLIVLYNTYLRVSCGTNVRVHISAHLHDRGCRGNVARPRRCGHSEPMTRLAPRLHLYMCTCLHIYKYIHIYVQYVYYVQCSIITRTESRKRSIHTLRFRKRLRACAWQRCIPPSWYRVRLPRWSRDPTVRSRAVASARMTIISESSAK